MEDVIDLTNPGERHQWAIVQLLREAYPDTEAFHAALFFLAMQFSPITIGEAVSATGMSVIDVQGAFNDLSDVGLVEGSRAMALTEAGRKLVDDAHTLAQTMGDSPPH